MENNKNWFVGVSFKTELLSEYVIQSGYKSLGPLLGLDAFIKNRKNVDNEICAVKEDYDNFASLIRKDYQKNIPHCFEVVKTISEDFINKSAKLINRHLTNLSNEELADIFNNYIALFEKAGGLIGIPVLCEIALMEILQQKFNNLDLNNKISFNEFIRVIAFSFKHTTTFQERNNFLQLAKEVFDNETLKSLFLHHNHLEIISYLQKENPLLLTKIEDHAKKYSWILKTMFLGEEYTSEKIIPELKKEIENDPQIKINHIKFNREEQIEELQELTANISEELKKDIALYQDLIYFRDVRLEWLTKGCHNGLVLLQEIAKRLKINFVECIYLMPLEINNALTGKLKINTEEINQRIEKYALVMEDNEIKLYTGNEAEKQRVHREIRNKSELKGKVASQGKARGRVRIIKDRTELYKIEKGDILITPLTTPDFVIAMEKAAAIVTDLGGLTSHASIVSRELGVPCIVGTEYATKIFKDGDWVEVDAVEGIIRKIEKED